MRNAAFSFLTILLLLLTAAIAEAETRYISDQLIVTVRTGAGNQYQIIETLKSDSPIEILEETAEYVKARTPKGTEGYILKQYVTKAIPKTQQIADLKKQKVALEKKLQRQQQELQEASGLATSSQGIVEQLNSDLKNTTQQLDKVSRDFQQLKERSENVVNLTTERDQLLEENSLISSELKVLQEENKDFHRSNMIQWFLAGGGVFFGGWLAGKISRKKRGYSRF